jgi:hypothetical protein
MYVCAYVCTYVYTYVCVCMYVCMYECTMHVSPRAVWKISSHFEYLDNRSRGLYLIRQPVRGDLTAHP